MKFRYLILTEDYDVYGTNEASYAVECSNTNIVYDLMTGQCLAEGIDEIPEVSADMHTNPDTGKFWSQE